MNTKSISILIPNRGVRLRVLAFWGAFLAGTNTCVLLADDLVLGDPAGGAGDEVTLPIGLVNESAIVGLQFDLLVPAEAASIGPPRLITTATDHEAESRSLDGRRRLIVASLANMTLPTDLILEVPVSVGVGAPAGGPSIGVENVIFTDANGTAVAADIIHPPIEQWRREEFPDEQRLDPEIVGDDRDPDRDGLSNLAEFILGTRPTVASNWEAAGIRVTSSEKPDGAGIELALELRAEAGRDNTVELVGETSGDLDDWTTEGVMTFRTAEDDGEGNRYRFSLQSSETAEGRFLRVRFIRRSASP